MKYIKLLFLFLLTFIIISCGTESIPTTYTLTTVVNGEGSVSPSSGEYNKGETVTITSSPNEGWVFENWAGDVSGTSNSVTVIIDGNKQVIGNFIRKDYPLKISIEGEGTVIEQIISQPKATDYPYGTIVELTASPSEGWEFVGWSGDIESTNEIIQVTVDTEINISIAFQRKSYPLNVTIEGNGSVTEEIVQRKTNDYEQGSIVELTPVPSQGWEFIEWSGDLNGEEIPKRLVIDSEKFVTANFEPSGTLSKKIIYKYDSNNNLVEELYYDSQGFLLNIIKYRYNSNNKLIEKGKYNSNLSTDLKWVYKYNSSDNLIKRVEYDYYMYELNDSTKWEYVHDYYNTLKEIRRYVTDYPDGDFVQLNYFKYTYNSNDKITLIDKYTRGPKDYKCNFTYTYDINYQKVKLFKITGYNLYLDRYSNLVEDKEYEKYFTYDEDKNLTKIIANDGNGNHISKITYKYNSNNNIIESEYFNSLSFINSLHRYIYDESNKLRELNIYTYNQYVWKDINLNYGEVIYDHLLTNGKPSISFNKLIEDSKCMEIY